MKSTRLFLAVDSGGSKSQWVLLNEFGETIKTVKTKGLGAVEEGILPVFDIIKDAFEFFMPFGKIEYLYLSLGGPNTKEVELSLKSFWNYCPVTVEREANGNSILNAAEILGCNSVVMCGTGSTAIGNTEQGRKYCGGWGPVYGDGGSGGGLCTNALRIFLRSLDGLEPESRLSEIFCDLTKGLNLKDFDQRMEVKKRAIELDRRTLASFTPKIYNLFLEGDNTAKKLYSKAAKEIADMAFCVSDNNEKTKIIICGGFLKNSPLLIEEITKYFSKISKASIIYNPYFTPIVASKITVLQKIGIEIDNEKFKKLLYN